MTEVLMASLSLRVALAGIGEPTSLPLSLNRSFGHRTPSSLRTAMAGMSDPRVESWIEVGTALKSENTDLSEEAQGVATDGSHWYVCSNNTKAVVVFDNAGNRVATYKPSSAIIQQMWKDAGSPAPPFGVDQPWLLAFGRAWNPHFGAPAWHGGSVLVPIQDPRGIWRFRVDGARQMWQKAVELPDENLFPWCDIHPVTGVLYTSNFDAPAKARAYDTDSLVRRPKDDISLAAAPIPLDHVQGGFFTERGRLLLVRSDYNAVFCYSSLNGHCFGAKKLGDYGSIWSEVESITVRAWEFGGLIATVHILELDNDWPDRDDFYLHSYQIPDPSRL